MTSHTKRYIEIEDVLTLKLICKECGSSLEIPVTRDIGRSQDLFKLDVCPICKSSWPESAESSIQPEISGLSTALKKLREKLKSPHIGVMLTLEVAEETPKEAKL
jgi:hypothetical protein